MHSAQRNLWLHAVAVAVLTQQLAVIAFVGQHIPAALLRATLAAWQADLLQQRHEVARVGLFTGGQHDSQREAVAVAGQVYLVVSPPRLRPRQWCRGPCRPPFFPAPLAARVARIEVESTIQVSRSIKRS